MSRKKNSYLSSSNIYQDAWNDLKEGLLRYNVWIELGLQEIKLLYRGSIIGAAWIVLSFLIFASMLVWFFGGLTNTEASYFTSYLVIGLWVFQFLSVSISSGCTVFLSAEGWLRSTRMPLSLFVYKLVFRNLFNFILTGLAMAAVLAVLKHPISSAVWIVIPAIIVMILNSVWITLFLGFVTVRFRDFQHLVTTIMRFSFFVTPVVWVASDIGTRAHLALFNPLTHFIAIIRDPILTGQSVALPWIVVSTITIIGWSCTYFLFADWRRQIIYWL